MGIDNVIKIAVALTITTALSGQLPRVTRAIQVAQAKLLKESRASKWRSPDVLFSKVKGRRQKASHIQCSHRTS